MPWKLLQVETLVHEYIQGKITLNYCYFAKQNNLHNVKLFQITQIISHNVKLHDVLLNINAKINQGIFFQ